MLFKNVLNTFEVVGRFDRTLSESLDISDVSPRSLFRMVPEIER
jgi:hypothetical protein